MIFRGRSISDVSVDFLNGAHGFLNAVDFAALGSGLAGMGGALAELVGGPALGVALNVLWVILSYKTLSLTYSKLFNRRK
jgi:hypothetical protein